MPLQVHQQPYPYIIVTKDPAKGSELNNVPFNKAHEVDNYLKFILDYYDDLPPRMIFMHGSDGQNGYGQWHNPFHPDRPPPVRRRLHTEQLARVCLNSRESLLCDRSDSCLCLHWQAGTQLYNHEVLELLVHREEHEFVGLSSIYNGYNHEGVDTLMNQEQVGWVMTMWQEALLDLLVAAELGPLRQEGGRQEGKGGDQ